MIGPINLIIIISPKIITNTRCQDILIFAPVILRGVIFISIRHGPETPRWLTDTLEVSSIRLLEHKLLYGSSKLNEYTHVKVRC